MDGKTNLIARVESTSSVLESVFATVNLYSKDELKESFKLELKDGMKREVSEERAVETDITREAP